MSEEELLSRREEALELLGQYEAILTPKQRKVLNEYLRYDLSLGEIAEEDGVSRAAVHDAIAKSIAKLREYEEKLHLLEKKKDIKAMLETIERVEDDAAKLQLYQQFGKDLSDGI